MYHPTTPLHTLYHLFPCVSYNGMPHMVHPTTRIILIDICLYDVRVCVCFGAVPT